MTELRRSPRGRFLSTSGGALATGLFGVSYSRSVSAADNYTLRLSVPTNQTSAMTVTCLQMAAAVERRSSGRLKIEVYPSNQLASSETSIDGLNSGSVDMTMQPTTYLQPLFPRLEVLDLPFMFKNTDAAFRLIDGPVGNDLFSEFETKGVVGLFWGGTGFRELETTTKAVRVPDDMKGLRIRIQGGPLYVQMYQALGAIPVSIDPAEAYAAMLQRTVDGLEINLEQIVARKFYTVTKHVAMTNHTYSFLPMVVSKKKLDSLPTDLQALLKDEAKKNKPVQRNFFIHALADAEQTLKANGVTFTEIDYSAFRRAMDPLYASFQSKIGADYMQRVIRAANT